MHTNQRFFWVFLAKLVATFTTFVCAVTFSTLALAQTQPAPQFQVSGDEMSAATRDYLKASGAEKQYSLILNLMVDGARDGARQLLAESLRAKPLEATSNKEANDVVNRLVEQYMVNARKVLSEKITWAQMVEEVHLPVYRRNFTVAEMKQAAEFHRSPVGKKLQDRGLAVAQDVTRALSEIYGPVVQRENQPFAEELVKKARAELGKLK